MPNLEFFVYSEGEIENFSYVLLFLLCYFFFGLGVGSMLFSVESVKLKCRIFFHLPYFPLIFCHTGKYLD